MVIGFVCNESYTKLGAVENSLLAFAAPVKSKGNGKSSLSNPDVSTVWFPLAFHPSTGRPVAASVAVAGSVAIARSVTMASPRMVMRGWATAAAVMWSVMAAPVELVQR